MAIRSAKLLKVEIVDDVSQLNQGWFVTLLQTLKDGVPQTKRLLLKREGKLSIKFGDVGLKLLLKVSRNKNNLIKSLFNEWFKDVINHRLPRYWEKTFLPFVSVRAEARTMPRNWYDYFHE
jgi:hypothetical protein